MPSAPDGLGEMGAARSRPPGRPPAGPALLPSPTPALSPARIDSPVHHTDCGSALMADPQLRAGVVERGFDDATLRRTAVVDLAQTVPGDVARIIEAPAVSGEIVVSGYGYDVRTGLLTRITAPTSRNGVAVPATSR